MIVFSDSSVEGQTTLTLLCVRDAFWQTLDELPGAGTMGSSTALHLARRGYTNITILDTYPIPSLQSAGFDLNKIAGGGDNTGFRGQMLDKIMKGWREDPVFKDHYHEVGRVSSWGSRLVLGDTLQAR